MNSKARSTCVLVALVSFATAGFGCTTDITVLDGGDTAAIDDGVDGSTDGGSSGSVDPGVDPGVEAYGVPCAYLHGRATIPSWDGDEASYPASLFSFELASSDFGVVRNDGDVLYTDNYFLVNTVVDDTSFIVDLGDLELSAVPSTVSLDEFPTGEWGEHDAIQAVAHHTYAVRTLDGNTRQWAAFRITEHSPGVVVTLEWIRSPDVDALVVPTACM
jgi:hypothetical protein